MFISDINAPARFECALVTIASADIGLQITNHCRVVGIHLRKWKKKGITKTEDFINFLRHRGNILISTLFEKK